MIDQSRMDKYAKKLLTPMMIKLFIYAQLKNLSSLGRISNHVKRKKKVQKHVGLESISKSQLSRKLRDIPSYFFYAILQQMIQKLHQTLGHSQAYRALGKIHLIDSSTLSMYLHQYEWADFRKIKSGVKMHTPSILYDDEFYCENNLWFVTKIKSNTV